MRKKSATSNTNHAVQGQAQSKVSSKPSAPSKSSDGASSRDVDEFQTAPMPDLSPLRASYTGQDESYDNRHAPSTSSFRHEEIDTSNVPNLSPIFSAADKSMMNAHEKMLAYNAQQRVEMAREEERRRSIIRTPTTTTSLRSIIRTPTPTHKQPNPACSGTHVYASRKNLEKVYSEKPDEEITVIRMGTPEDARRRSSDTAQRRSSTPGDKLDGSKGENLEEPATPDILTAHQQTETLQNDTAQQETTARTDTARDATPHQHTTPEKANEKEKDHQSTVPTPAKKRTEKENEKEKDHQSTVPTPTQPPPDNTAEIGEALLKFVGVATGTQAMFANALIDIYNRLGAPFTCRRCGSTANSEASDSCTQTEDEMPGPSKLTSSLGRGGRGRGRGRGRGGRGRGGKFVPPRPVRKPEDTTSETTTDDDTPSVCQRITRTRSKTCDKA